MAPSVHDAGRRSMVMAPVLVSSLHIRGETGFGPATVYRRAPGRRARVASFRALVCSHFGRISDALSFILLQVDLLHVDLVVNQSAMIRLFVSDIDGCIAEPYQPFDLALIRHLVDRIHTDDPAVPDFSLCSGRSYSYVEAIYQLLGLEFPVLFESGGGMFDPATSQISWNPALTREALEALAEIRAWINKECLPGTSMMFDHGKRTQAGIVGPDEEEVARVVPRVQEYVYENFEGFHVFDTPISIDISVAGITKRQALQWIGTELDVPLESVAYIGDTNGDIPALEIVGRSYAPSNGSDEVKAIVDRVTRNAVTAGVIEAYEETIDENRSSSV